MGLLSEAEIKVLENVLATNPKAKRKIVSAVREVVPDLNVPLDVQMAEETERMFDEKIKPLNETIESLRAELAKKEKDDSWSKQLSQLKNTRGWTDKQLNGFLKNLEEEFKDRREMTLDELAEYHEFKSQPLTPTQSGRSFFGPRGETEQAWRTAVRDPNSEFMKAVRNGNHRKKKEIKTGWWNQSRDEWVDLQRSRHPGI